ncbi:DNA-directed RNA polymerase subunit beta [Nocardia sp. NPDC047648]|uniref:DNA-directed RNA polymerase subunit beta n=1 Tax=Nocardia sp. NPDC047648 TaxID=3155625 RepID=UPI00340DA52D
MIGVPRSGDTPQSRCEFYRTTCQLPTVVDPDSGLITMQAGPVWGVMMPAALGQAVKVDLEQRRLGGGPIVSHPRSSTWTFLTRSDISQKLLDDTAAQLFRHGVTVIGTGGEIRLPSPSASPNSVRYWVSPAQGPLRPSGVVVVEAVRARTARSRQQLTQAKCGGSTGTQQHLQ